MKTPHTHSKGLTLEEITARRLALKTAITELGNYGEIYERNLGSLSDLNIEREKNKLIVDGGLIIPQSFF